MADEQTDPTDELYSLDEVLGKGHFGVVQAVTHRETKRRYACKLVKTQHLNINLLKSEVKILQACKHPNIISVKEVFATIKTSRVERASTSPPRF